MTRLFHLQHNPDPTIWTFQDCVEQLLDWFDVPRDDRNRRIARQAVLRAHRDLPNRTRWNYFDRRATILTTAEQTSSTITYDHTGGTNEREVTIAAGTWPSDAAFGRLIISDVHYDVDRRVSDTVLTLSPINNPGADVAAGTSYTWYRSTYPLPVDFRKLGRVFDVDNEHEISIVGTDVHHAANIHFYDTPDTPWQAVIRNHGEHYGGMEIEFGPPPSTARSYDLIYEAAPRPLLVENYSTGTVSITGGTASVTGSGSTFPASCVGSVMRFSSDGTNAPTSPIGSPLPDGSGTDNLYAAQRVIIARASGTAVTLDANVSSTLSAVKYVISDPIDIEQSAMFTAFHRMAEAEFARLVRDENERKYQLDARQAIVDAMEADQRSTYTRGGVRYSRFSRVIVSTDAG